VLRKINNNLQVEAADAILMWNKVNKKVNPHQVKRRQKERALFVKPQ
jgi:lysozyme